MSAPRTVVLVDDHALTRAGLRTELVSGGEFEVVGEAGDGETGYAEIRARAPHVAVIDIALPALDGIELTHRLRRDVPATRIVILTMREDERDVFAALAAGADAYCLKSSSPSVVRTAVRAAADGAAYFDPQIAHVVLRGLSVPTSGESAPRSPLTPRELDVLRLIADGVGNVEIADRLAIGLGTVKGHIRDILEKLGASDRTQAAVTALRRGLL